MKYEWIETYCLKKMGTVQDYKPEWEATRYMVGGKMFALQGNDKEGKPIITLKLAPMDGQALRSQYSDIVPGYYMNKDHWNSLYLEGEVPDHILQDMIDQSYQLVFHSLSKKAQLEIQS